MQRHKELLKKIEEQNSQLEKMELNSINSMVFEKDQLICELIKASQPPYYLTEKIQKLVSYRALLLYFIENFTSELEVNVSTLNFKIRSETNNFFHLLDIHNKSKFIRKNQVHEKIIYNVVKFGDFNRSRAKFTAKVASLGWIKETLTNPDFIYAKEANLSKNLRFDYLFVRKTGEGTKTKPYMYHLVGVVNTSGKSGRNIYKINSQFPIEKDKNLSNGESKISRLHEYVMCEKFFFKKEDVQLPKCPKQNINRDMAKLDKWKDNF